jgi:hypothetical protein
VASLPILAADEVGGAICNLASFQFVFIHIIHVVRLPKDESENAGTKCSNENSL